MPAPPPTHLSSIPPAGGVLSWLGDLIGLSGAELHTKLRGNILHVLCETTEPLEQSPALLRLIRGLLETEGNSIIQQTYPQVYQIYIYSRISGQSTPDWTAPIYLNRLERHLAQLVLDAQDEADLKATQSLLETYAQHHPDAAALGNDGAGGALVLSNLSLARKGDPDAIAWYLSETLSGLDVGVWVSIKAIPGTAHLHKGAITAETLHAAAAASTLPDFDGAAHDTTIPRLWILCEATYSPDPSLIARPTAERLRQLQLTQFKDAVLLLQVRGESRPDWSLRIDLTPPEEMLREWARWGDCDAITRLLNATLDPLHIAVEAELKHTTLHLVCSPLAGDHDTHQDEALAAKDQVQDGIQALLTALAPQGIHRAVIYGQGAEAHTPLWVRYLELPASQHEALTDPPEILGMYGDLPAIAFLLTRQLNPNLDDQLATGGLRVQLLMRDYLLHIMVDGPVIPWRRQITPVITDYLLKLSPQQVEGVRIYGRRSGQPQPAWSYGKDFIQRDRLVPESTPEFSASESYVNELLVRPDAPVIRTDVSAEATRQALGQWAEQVSRRMQQVLLQSQLFSVQSTELQTETIPSSSGSDRLKIALVWGAIGVLLALQLDWLLGQLLSPPANTAMADRLGTPEASPVNPPQESPPATPDPAAANPFSGLDWRSTADNRDSSLQSGQFTDRPDQSFIDTDQATGDNSLDKSPMQPIVATDELLLNSPFSTFNSQQLNEKLALYLKHIQESGPPDVMIVGSSRALRGVDPVALRQELGSLGYKNISIFNFGINGATAQVVDLIIRQLLTPEQLPRLILWADGARAFNSGREDLTYNAIVASAGYRELLSQQEQTTAANDDSGQEATSANATTTLTSSYQNMDHWLSDQLGTLSAVAPERDRLKAWLQEQMVGLTKPIPTGSPRTAEKLDAPMPEGSVIDFDGFLALSIRFNPATYYQSYARVPGLYDGDYEDFRLEGQQDEAFHHLLSFAQQQSIPIVFVNTPLTDEYLDDYRQQAEDAFRKHMLELSTSESGFIFRDLSMLWPERYDYFSDPSHLNRYGAYQVSNHLAQDPIIAWPRPLPTDTP